MDIAFSSLENRESAFFVFSEKAMSEAKDMYIVRADKFKCPFFLIPIERGPITLLKRIAHMAQEYRKQEKNLKNWQANLDKSTKHI